MLLAQPCSTHWRTQLPASQSPPVPTLSACSKCSSMGGPIIQSSHRFEIVKLHAQCALHSTTGGGQCSPVCAFVVDAHRPGQVQHT